MTTPSGYPEQVTDPSLHSWETLFRVWNAPEDLWVFRYISRGVWSDMKVTRKMLEDQPEMSLRMVLERGRYGARRVRLAGPRGRLP